MTSSSLHLTLFRGRQSEWAEHLTLLGMIPRSRIVSSRQDEVGGAAAMKEALSFNS